MPDRVKDKIKHAGQFYQGLSPDLKGFYDDYYNLTGKYLTITSGKRTASKGVGKNSKISRHNTGEAIDISASHIDDYRFLMNTQEGLNLLTKYGLGVIDETNPDELEKTGGTGAHFHIGKDSFYAKQVKSRYDNFLSGKEFKEIKAYADKREIAPTQQQQNQPLTTIPEKAIEDFGYSPLDMRVAEKQIIKETKTEQDEDRQEITKAKKEYEEKVNFLESYKQHTNQKVAKSIEAVTDYERNLQNPYEGVQLQDYDPNRFLYNQNIQQQ